MVDGVSSKSTLFITLTKGADLRALSLWSGVVEPWTWVATLSQLEFARVVSTAAVLGSRTLGHHTTYHAMSTKLTL